MRLYLDSSAIVKLVQLETESEALRRYLRDNRGDTKVTSALARVEVPRAVLSGGAEALSQARRQLSRLHQISLDGDLLDRAARVAPTTLLRSLDAIHIASAQLLGDELRAIVTYDQRMIEVATSVGLPVAAPA